MKIALKLTPFFFLLSACSTAMVDSNDNINREGVRQSVRQALPQIKACYTTKLESKPELQGKVVVEITINNSGRTVEKDSKIVSTTLQDSEVENCLLGILNKISYPETPKGKLAVITYPFIFGNKNTQ